MISKQVQFAESIGLDHGGHNYITRPNVDRESMAVKPGMLHLESFQVINTKADATPCEMQPGETKLAHDLA